MVHLNNHPYSFLCRSLSFLSSSSSFSLALLATFSCLCASKPPHIHKYKNKRISVPYSTLQNVKRLQELLHCHVTKSFTLKSRKNSNKFIQVKTKQKCYVLCFTLCIKEANKQQQMRVPFVSLPKKCSQLHPKTTKVTVTFNFQPENLFCLLFTTTDGKATLPFFFVPRSLLD